MKVLARKLTVAVLALMIGGVAVAACSSSPSSSTHDVDDRYG